MKLPFTGITCTSFSSFLPNLTLHVIHSYNHALPHSHATSNFTENPIAAQHNCLTSRPTCTQALRYHWVGNGARLFPSSCKKGEGERGGRSVGERKGGNQRGGEEGKVDGEEGDVGGKEGEVGRK